MRVTADSQAARDELVAGILAAAPGGLTGYAVDRKVRAALGCPGGWRRGGSTGRQSLLRLEAAGRARCEEEPSGNPAGFRRVWYPMGEA